MRQGVALGVTAGLILLLALEQGAYDLVIRQQAAVLLWWAIALAAAVGLLPRTRPTTPGWVVIGALVLLGVWTSASLVWTSDQERTLVEVARVAAHLGVVVLVAAALGRDTWRPALAGATIAAAAVCCLALGSRLFPGTFGRDVVAQAFGHNRLSYPFGYWNAVGAWAGMTSALCLAWSAHATRRVVRAAALAVVPVAVATSYVTYSRASLGGTVLGLVVLFCASRNRFTLSAHALVAAIGGVGTVLAIRGAEEIARGEGGAGAGVVVLVLGAAAGAGAATAWATARFGLDSSRLSPRTGRTAWIVGGATVLVIAGVAVATVGPKAWDQFRDVRNTQSQDPAERLQSLNGSRYAIWDVALHDFRSHKIEGTGAGTYEYSWNQRGSLDEFARDGHSLYLESASELGAVGLLAVLLLVVGAGWSLIRALTAQSETSARGALAGATAAAAAFFFGAGVDWLWESTAVAVLALVLVGVAMAATGVPVGRLPWWSRAGLTAGAIALCLLQLPGLVATSSIRESRAAFNARDFPRAMSKAQEAVDSEPWASSPFVQRALVLERQRDYAAAVYDLARARQRAPEDWRIPLLLARVEARRGDAAAALAAYRQARELRPLGQFFSQRVRTRKDDA